jgi:hypothetical protein
MQWMRLWISLWGKLCPMAGRRVDEAISACFSGINHFISKGYVENLW